MSGLNQPSSCTWYPQLIQYIMVHYITLSFDQILVDRHYELIARILFLRCFLLYRQQFYAFLSWYGCWFLYAGHVPANLYDGEVHGNMQYPANA